MTMIVRRTFAGIHAAAVCQTECNTFAAPQAPGIVPAQIADGLTWSRAAAEAFGLIGLPAAVLSSSHRLGAANVLMERLIPQVVQDRPSRIGLADRRADAMLAEALRQTQHPAGPVRSVPIAATANLPASIVHIVPVTGMADDAFAAASCMLVITAVARPEIASATIIQDLFDLTPAEARVAHGIAAGKTVHDLADEAGIACGTVRQQLKSVFSKTGVSRQADLVGMLARSALGSSDSVPSAGIAEPFGAVQLTRAAT